MRGTSTFLDDVTADLRDHTPLVDQLPEAEAIYPGHPTDDRGYPVSVALTVTYDGSTPHRGATTRTYRLQATVVSTQPWRQTKRNEAGTTALAAQQAILDAVADRLDTAAGAKPEYPIGAEVGPTPQTLEGNRVAVIGDWRLRGTYTTDA